MTDGATPTALIVVDVQQDFCEGGSLAVSGGNAVAGAIARLLATGWDRYAAVVATRDHHIDPGTHFSATPDFVDSWPAHCVVGTDGAAFHPALAGTAFDAIVDKGAYRAAYSGFEGATATGEGLADWLRAAGIGAVQVCGLATDHCVRATALDAVRAGFVTTLRDDLVAAVAPATGSAALVEMAAAGITIAREPPETRQPGAQTPG